MDIREQICAMCRSFYTLGWVSGTGGGISIRHADRIYMAPSGVEKERIQPTDIFVLDLQGNPVEGPGNPTLKLTECAPLFLSAYDLRNAGAVIHSHSMNVLLATMLAERRAHPEFVSVLRFTQLEMIKGLAGHGYNDVYELPVIDNTARECELTDTLRQAMQLFPRSNAVAVRNHGIYVWGDSATHAKTQAECLDYLCEAKVRMRQLGLPDPADAIAVASS